MGKNPFTLQVLYNDRKAIDWLPVIIYYENRKASHHLPSSPPKADPSVIKPEGFALYFIER